jgi:hypothetical protein
MIPSTGAPVPSRTKDVHWVEQLAASERQQWRIWSKCIWGVWTHYHDDKSTSPCYKDHTRCKGGHDPVSLRWKGYVMGWCFKLNRPAFVQLTQASVDAWTNQLAEGTPIRGQTLLISRTAKKNGRLVIEVQPYQTVDPSSVPPDCDPRASLYNLWKLEDHGWAWATHPLRSLNDLNLVG